MFNDTDLNRLIEFIENLPDGNSYIFYEDNEWNITNEFLCDQFSGISFQGKTKVDALIKLCEYFDNHINHSSIVGRYVTESGWPNLDLVFKYINNKLEIN